MKKINKHLRALFFALAIALGASLAPAQNLPDADTREIMAYTLTESALGKYMQATRNLSGVKVEDCDDDSGVRSLAEAAAKIDAVPGARAAVQSAGMTSREYVLFAFSLIQNGFAAYALNQPGGKLPQGISMANVDFFRKHSGDMEELANETKEGGCAGDEDDGN